MRRAVPSGKMSQMTSASGTSPKCSSIHQTRPGVRTGSELISWSLEESITVDITPGTWDIQVVDEDGDSYTIWTEEIGQTGFTWNVTLDDMD